MAEQETTLAGVAAAHVEALDAQIRTLRLRRGVLAVQVDAWMELAELVQRPRLARELRPSGL